MSQKNKLRIIFAIIGAASLAAGCFGIIYEVETAAFLKTLSASSILLEAIHLAPYIFVFLGGIMLLAVTDNTQSNQSNQNPKSGPIGTGMIHRDFKNGIINGRT